MRVVVRQSWRGRGGDDRVGAFEVPGGVLVALADGAGGLSGGRRAAEMVVDAVREMAKGGGAGWSPAGLCSVLGALDGVVERDARAGETTAVVVAVFDGRLVGASCGDSEAWLVGSERVVLTEGQVRKRIGSGKARPVGFSVDLAEGARALLGSDGLFGFARADAVERACGLVTLEEAAEAALECARMSNGEFGDDVSVVVIGAH